MSRQAALDRAARHYDSGAFLAALGYLVQVPSVSQTAQGIPHLAAYLTDHLRPALEHMGFVCQVLVNPAPGGPLLLAERIEDPDLPTVLVYGHGDVVRGLDDAWAEGLSPWELTEREGRIYGRGVADNKGQHAINLAALGIAIAERQHLGFNVKVLIETSEEIGSPGLREICENHQTQLAADLLLASDGPRLAPDQPTIFLGNRGALNFDLIVDLREAGQHSGNWGGLLANPAIRLAHAIATIVTQHRGDPARRAEAARRSRRRCRRALADVSMTADPGAPAIDPGWGEPGLSAGREGVRLEQLRGPGLDRGQPGQPGQRDPTARRGALPDPLHRRHRARARSCRRSASALDAAGLAEVEVRPAAVPILRATRTDPEHRWVGLARRSIERTTGRPPVVLPNLGGSLPNDCFAEILGLPTIWVPHSYRGCGSTRRTSTRCRRSCARGC